MKCYLSVACVLSVLVALSYAAPMPQSEQGLDTRSTTTRIAEGINNKLRMLRQYCPQLFQVIDNVIQNVTSTAFRVIGRAVLQSGGLGGGGGGGGGESRVSVVLPTFGPDEDYDDEDEDTNAVSGGSTTPTTTTTTTTTPQTIPDADAQLNEIRVEPNIQTEINEPNNAINEITSNTTEENEISDDSSTEKTLYTSPAGELSRRKRDLVRKIRAAEDEVDQDVAASGGNGPSPSEDLANVDAEDADRDKRFSPFGGSFGGHAGSSGGSGNFLFDIIRRTADGAARAAGTVYRMIAGTENTDNFGVGLTGTATSARYLQPQLIAGSGATEESDEKENGPIGAGGVAEIDVAKDAEGIPGPVTRLFVLANRGLANLVQDLILRLAQTSERIVNFKARLITALI